MKALILTGRLVIDSDSASRTAFESTMVQNGIMSRSEVRAKERMKALIITGKLATDSEYVYALYRLKEAGFEVDVAVRDNVTVLGAIGEKIVPTRDIPSKFEDGEYQLLILPGGAKAMEYMRQDQDVLNYIAAYHKAGGVIGSICHAAQLLISAGLVRGRRVSGYYSIKDDINNAGGTYVDAPFVTDDRIVSSPHYKHLGPWMKEVLRQALA